jgi:hypothetical protein
MRDAVQAINSRSVFDIPLRAARWMPVEITTSTAPERMINNIFDVPTPLKGCHWVYGLRKTRRT